MHHILKSPFQESECEVARAFRNAGDATQPMSQVDPRSEEHSRCRQLVYLLRYSIMHQNIPLYF